MRFMPNPHAPDGSMNEQRFLALNKSMADQRIVSSFVSNTMTDLLT